MLLTCVCVGWRNCEVGIGLSRWVIRGCLGWGRPLGEEGGASKGRYLELVGWTRGCLEGPGRAAISCQPLSVLEPPGCSTAAPCWSSSPRLELTRWGEECDWAGCVWAPGRSSPVPRSGVWDGWYLPGFCGVGAGLGEFTSMVVGFLGPAVYR